MSTSTFQEYKEYKEYVWYIGRAVKFFRERAKMPQEQLAEAINVSVTYVSLIENAHRVPTIQTILTLF